MVIAILAILALIAIPAYTQYRQRAAVAADAATCKVIYDATAMALASGLTVTSNAVDAAIDADVVALLDPGISLTPQAGGANFVVTVNGANVTSVANGGAGALAAIYP